MRWQLESGESKTPIRIEDVIREERAFLGLSQEVNPAVYTEAAKRDAVDTDDVPWALCLSGGGIRSATFSLGVLQGLARIGELCKFHYLSTVSGGGYIGSWLTRWIHAEQGDLQKVAEALAANGGQHAPSGEPKQVSRLRGFSNYLSPVWGLSTDFFTLVTILLRNLFLNWLVLLPLILVLVLLPRVYIGASVDPDLSAFAVTTVLVLAAVLIVIGIAYVAADLPGESFPSPTPADRFRLFCFAPIVAAAALLGLVTAWSTSLHRVPGSQDCTWYVAAGALLHVIGCAMGLCWRSVRGYPVDCKQKPAVAGALKGVVAIGLSGACGGLLVYALAVWLPEVWTIFKQPDVHAALAAPLLLVVLWLATTIYVALAKNSTSEGDREWWARSGAWWLRAILVWLVGFGLVAFVPPWLSNTLDSNLGVAAAGGGIWGLGVALIGYWTKNGAKITDRANTVIGKIGMGLLDLAAIGFLLVLVIAFCAVVDFTIEHTPAMFNGPSERPLGLGPVSADNIETAARATEAAARVAAARGGNAEASPGKSTPQELLIQADVAKAGAAASTLVAAARAAKGNANDMVKGAEAAAHAAETLARARPAIEKTAPAAAVTLAKAQRDVSDAAATLLRKADIDLAKTSPEAWGTQYSTRMTHGEVAWPLSFTLLLLAISFVSSRYVGVNMFSLHSMYGNRLVRAYFGAARATAPRQPHWFTGFDFHDNVAMGKLAVARLPADATVAAGEAQATGAPRLLHIVNIALNIVSAAGGRLEWQQRKAASFTVSAKHSGSDVVGFLPSCDYSSISLGRAMTISGAAASPNMGYHSSTPVALVMTLFNVRLGWWLPNPGYHGQSAGKIVQETEPPWALRPLLWEALSATTADRPYLYLSDGGHFDNLGLYEMVRRGCRRILVVDASADPNGAYDDLQDVMRKIRVDFGIPIEFKPHALDMPQRCVIGDIRYRKGDVGRIYYLKPTLRGDEPLDVLHYAHESRLRDPKNAFPHQPTADQFFNEAQFESYRLLGLHTILKLWNQGTEDSWPTKDTLRLYERELAPKAAAVGAPPDTAAHDSPSSQHAGKGWFSGISEAARSMSQGALVATAVGVGAVGTAGVVTLRDAPAQVADKSGAHRPPSASLPPASQVDADPPVPDGPLKTIAEKIERLQTQIQDAMTNVPGAVGASKPDEPNLSGSRLANIQDRLEEMKQTQQSSQNNDIVKGIQDLRQAFQDGIKQIPRSVGTVDPGDATVSGNRLADIQNRLQVLEKTPIKLQAIPQEQFKLLSKNIDALRTEIQTAFRNVPATVGALDPGNVNVSGNRLAEIQNRVQRLEDINRRLERLEATLNQAPAVRGTR